MGDIKAESYRSILQEGLECSGEGY